MGRRLARFKRQERTMEWTNIEKKWHEMAVRLQGRTPAEQDEAEATSEVRVDRTAPPAGDQPSAAKTTYGAMA